MFHRYFEQSETTALAIVLWCLDPSELWGLEYQEFVQRVSSVRGRSLQESRLHAIWKMAVDSVGCEAGPTVALEAQVMVEGLRQMRVKLAAKLLIMAWTLMKNKV